MDHHCHRCNALVAEDAPFCSQCGAPQIRVSVGQPANENGGVPPMPRVAASASTVNWRMAMPRVLAAAVIGTILLMIFPMLLPPLLVLLLIIPFTGAVSVWLYKGRDQVSGGKGFRLGAATGFFLFLLNLIAPVIAYLSNRSKFLELLKQQVDQAAKTADPRSQEMLRNLSQHPETVAAIVAMVAVIVLLMFVIACSIGGAIAGHTARHE